MDKIVCSDRSREILKEYNENNRFAMTLIEMQDKMDILKVLDLLEQMRRNWNYEKMRAEAMEEELDQRNKEKDGMRKEIRIYREQLRDARTQIATLMSDRKSMEYDIAEWERKFELVNDLLKEQSHLSMEDRQRLFGNGSTLNKKSATIRGTRSTRLNFSHDSSDEGNIDYDKTADTYDISSNEMDESRLRSGKFRSRSMVSLTAKRTSAVASKRAKKSMLIDTVEEEVETPSKRAKGETETHNTVMAAVNAGRNELSTAKVSTRNSMNRSLSAANIFDKSEGTLTLTANMLTPRCGTSSIDLRTPLSGVKTWTHGASISTRPHVYTNHSSILGDHCGVCNGWIGIVGKQAYKCCDCGLHIHKACINNAPVPCVPRTPTSRTPAKQRPRLKDLCPSIQPMIPRTIIHCILALEKDRLFSEGIYRIPGLSCVCPSRITSRDDSQVQKLLNEFQTGRSIPKLEYHDTETITSCVKQFLIKLRDPVIPSTSWEEFVNAAETNDIEALNHSIIDLPYPNRDTLAFLCAHFQKICENSIQNKMPPNVLARCVAAMIVGPAPPHVVKDDEEKKQVMVMLALLKMPSDYWPKFYNFDNGVPLINSPKSRIILNEYAGTISIAKFLAEGQNTHTEFIHLLDIMENIRQNWNAEKSRADALQEQMNTREYDYDGLRQENRMYKEQLRDARAQIALLMSDKQNLERDMVELERKFALVNELLKNDQSLLKAEDRQKLSFLDRKPPFRAPVTTEGQTHHVRISRTLSRGEDIDYDKTGDSMDISYDDSEESHLRNGKVYRRSRSLANLPSTQNSVATMKRSKEPKRMNIVTPCKRSKDGTETIITTTTITVDSEGRKPPRASVSLRRSNRSMSESNILNQNEETTTESTTKFSAITPRCGASALDLHTPCTAIKTWTNGSSIESRPHTFVNFTSILGDRCEVCNRWIGLTGKAAYKCADCGIRLHKLCTSNAPIPCVPRTATPRTPGKQRPRLKDFCPSTQPMIPSLIIHCVLALDKDRLSTEGIYRIPGQESLVVKLLNEFKNSRSLPKLEYHDTETITGCIKRFLREIRDPVIPMSSWDEFISAAERDDFEALNRSVMDLPFPNRDTLAFLCSHFQRVCDNRSRNKMSPEVLARCIAPTMIGHPPSRVTSIAQNAEHIGKQIMVMLALLKMPQNYWSKFFAFDQERPLLKTPASGPTAAIYSRESKTPVQSSFKISSNNGRKDPNKSMLGPVQTPPSGNHPKEFEPLCNKRGKFYLRRFEYSRLNCGSVVFETCLL
uniref:Phorbol-ester/DAG-type domain-containing protein n=1 Tax=Elaeophora elaphi TaxID=1147741 RepID=A0A158Q782_9BILA